MVAPGPPDGRPPVGQRRPLRLPGRSGAEAAGQEGSVLGPTATTRCSATGSSPTSRPTPSGDHPKLRLHARPLPGLLPGHRKAGLASGRDRRPAGHRNPANRVRPRDRPHRPTSSSRSRASTTPRPADPDFLEEKRRRLLVQRRPRPTAPRHRRPDHRRQQIENPGEANAGLDPHRHRQQPERIKIGYQLNGTQIQSGFSSFYAAPLTVPAMLDPTAQTFLNAGWDAVATLGRGLLRRLRNPALPGGDERQFLGSGPALQGRFPERKYQPLVDRVKLGVKPVECNSLGFELAGEKLSSR